MSNHTFIYYYMSLMTKLATFKHCIFLMRAAAGHNITLTRSAAGRTFCAAAVVVILESALDPDSAL